MFFDVNQGKRLLKERKNVKKVKSRMYEGFTNNNDANSSDSPSNANNDAALVAELDTLETIFNQARTDYSTAYNTLMNKTQGYIASPENMNLNINKNVNVNRVNDAINVVPTRVGCYKTTSSVETDEYIGTFNDSGTRTMPDTTGTYISYDDCKAQAIKGNYKYFGLQNLAGGVNNSTAYCSFSNDLQQTQALGSTDNILVGSDGRNYGGGWANAVYSINTATANDTTTGLTYQADLGSNVAAETCKVRAADVGAGAYALRGGTSGGGANNSFCYVGNTITNATSAGLAFTLLTTYEFIAIAGGIAGGVLNNGQVGVYSPAPNGSYPGLTPNVITLNDTPTLLTADPTTPASNTYCKPDTGALINTDETIASYGTNCKTTPTDAMVYGNNGSISCNRYCHGFDGTPWQGPSELPAEWKGAQCKSAGKYQTTSCDFVGQDPSTPGIMPCTCTRNDNFPYLTLPMNYAFELPWEGTPPIINPPTPSTGIGNWTSYIVNAVKGWQEGDYVVLSEGSDPAFGCAKQFSVNYKCGNGPTKNINLAAEAAGQTLHFDCTTENEVCWAYMLTINDNGTITITNGNEVADKQQVWSWNATITNSVPNDNYKAAKGKNGRNTLWTMEKLFLNEFIGSPNGNFHLIMLNDPVTNQAGLKVRYSVYNCSDTAGNDSTANVVYQLNPADKTLVGKVGFINGEGAIQEYPAEMISPSANNYDMFGNYNSVGHDLSSFTMANITSADCKTQCSATDNCAGFVFSTTDKTCYLKDSGMFPNDVRIPDSNSELFVRSKTVKGDISCPTTMDKGISAYEWAAMPVGEKMQMTTLCKLGLVTQAEQQDLSDKNAAVSIAAANLQDKINELVDNDMVLVNKLGNRVKMLQRGLQNYKGVHKNIAKTEYSIEGLTGLSVDSELQMISSNYKYMLMTILAIFLVGAIMKVARR
jgi:hypothetical protein